MANLTNKEIALHFKRSYIYKMGGTQTIVLPNGERYEFDDREYYKGRGSKYNSSIKHDLIGEIIISDKEISDYLLLIKKREESARVENERRMEKEKRCKEFKERINDWHNAPHALEVGNSFKSNHFVC